jgi:hypothetical protein
MINPDRDYTPVQVARMTNTTPALIRMYCIRGAFPRAWKVRGTRWLIPGADVELFVKGKCRGAFGKRD